MIMRVFSHSQMAESNLLGDEAQGLMSFFEDLAHSIPGIDEAMAFAQVMKYVNCTGLNWTELDCIRYTPSIHTI